MRNHDTNNSVGIDSKSVESLVEKVVLMKTTYEETIQTQAAEIDSLRKELALEKEASKGKSEELAQAKEDICVQRQLIDNREKVIGYKDDQIKLLKVQKEMDNEELTLLRETIKDANEKLAQKDEEIKKQAEIIKKYQKTERINKFNADNKDYFSQINNSDFKANPAEQCVKGVTIIKDLGEFTRKLRSNEVSQNFTSEHQSPESQNPIGQLSGLKNSR
jgi:hypothetical protein